MVLLGDALGIFGDERRCLHDLIAGTIVVDVKSEETIGGDRTAYTLPALCQNDCPIRSASHKPRETHRGQKIRSSSTCGRSSTTGPVARDGQSAAVADPVKYLQDLRDKTEYIDIRGLHVGKGQAHRLKIEELYISLSITDTARADSDEGTGGARRGKGRQADAAQGELDACQRRTVPLHQALSHDGTGRRRRSGAGETAFCAASPIPCARRSWGKSPPRPGIAWASTIAPFHFLAGQRMGLAPGPPHGSGRRAGRRVCPGLAAALPGRRQPGRSRGPERRVLPAATGGWPVHVLLDGLDEAPDRMLRERLARLIESAAAAFRGCRFVVTSRPARTSPRRCFPSSCTPASIPCPTRRSRRSSALVRGNLRRKPRVIRGGGWGSDARDCRAANRDRGEPRSRVVNLGFRVARGPSG